ncbi:MAG TPA: stage III sporulation protein AB [Candidatus Scybalomonas excrementigallinarum]|nr:stage III sporulation protein AB [Candidatus Scybalomonas excrementigallinarum]
MIKWSGILLIAVASVLLGFQKSMIFSERLKSLYQWKQCFLLIQREIEFQQASLPLIFTRLSNKMRGEFGEVFAQLAEQLQQKHGEDFSIIWENMWRSSYKKMYFTVEDLEVILSFGRNFSGVDRKKQVAAIDYFLAQLEEQLEDAREQKKMGQKLYQTLGVVGGFFLIIVLA